MIPKNCHLWLKKNITADDINFIPVKDYWEYSHDWRFLAKCSDCGQLYVSDSVETIDWINGNDKISTTIVPVSEEELKENDYSKISQLELLAFSPIILWNPDNKLKWIRINPLSHGQDELMI